MHDKELQIKRLIDFFDKSVGNDIASLTQFYAELNHDLAEFIESIYENQDKSPYVLELKSKLHRLYNANTSLISLSKGQVSNFRGKKLQVFDLNSIYALSRQLIESFIVIYYLYLSPVSPKHRDLRIIVYKIDGLLRQLDLAQKVDKDPDKKIEAMHEELEAYRNQLKNHPEFTEAAARTQKSWMFKLKNSPLLQKRDVILKEAGLQNLIIQWKLFSNYAHSEYVSDRQYNGFFGNEQAQIEFLCTTLNFNCRITARIIQHLAIKLSYGEKVISGLPAEHIERIMLWNSTSDNLQDRYQQNS